MLEAIFNESWSSLNEAVGQSLGEAEHGREAIVRILSLMIRAFSRDHEIAFLFLFEGRRMRSGSHEVLLSKGFVQFLTVIDSLIRRGQEDGSFRKDIEPKVLASAMLGCAEGLMRSRVLAERNKEGEFADDEAIVATFTAMVNGLA